MYTRNDVASYATYFLNSATVVAIEDSVVEKVTHPPVATSDILSESPWLATLFPDQIANGTLIVQNGEIFLGGINLLTIVSIIAVSLTLLITIARFSWDIFKSRKLKAETVKSQPRLCDCELKDTQ